MGWQKSLLSLSEPKILKVVNWLKMPSLSLYVVNRKTEFGEGEVFLRFILFFFSFSSVTLMINELTILVVALVFGQH